MRPKTEKYMTLTIIFNIYSIRFADKYIHIFILIVILLLRHVKHNDYICDIKLSLFVSDKKGMFLLVTYT